MTSSTVHSDGWVVDFFRVEFSLAGACSDRGCKELDVGADDARLLCFDAYWAWPTDDGTGEGSATNGSRMLLSVVVVACDRVTEYGREGSGG